MYCTLNSYMDRVEVHAIDVNYMDFFLSAI